MIGKRALFDQIIPTSTHGCSTTRQTTELSVAGGFRVGGGGGSEYAPREPGTCAETVTIF